MTAMRRLVLTVTLMLGGQTALAQDVTWRCSFDSRCSGTQCDSYSATYDFRLNLTSGLGAMIADGSRYDGTAWAGSLTQTFLMVNDAGAEMTSINPATGRVVYSGHLDYEGDFSTYELRGRCIRLSGKG
jgi:hypothetical protein